MKILYLCSDYGIPVLGRKGASVHVRALVNALAKASHAVTVVTPLLSKSPWESPATLDTPIMHVPASEMVVAAVDAARSFSETLGVTSTVGSELRRILYNQQLEATLLRRFQHAPPDVIYERAALFGTAGVNVARALAVPLILEVNAPLGLEQSAYRGSHLPELAVLAERRTLTGADLVLPVSSPLRDYVIEQGVVADRAIVVPNGIDPSLFRPGPARAEVRRRWGLENGPVVGFVGGLRPWHGVRALPSLLERLVTKHPDVRMVIAGDGPLRDELVLAFSARGLAPRVVFTGAVAHEDVPDIIHTFDVALAPYNEVDHLFYFSPLKVFEYMGCGVPLVAAALGQITEVVRHGETGVLYPPQDVDALTSACSQLLGDPAMRSRIGDAAAAATHASYTWAQNAARVAALAHSLMARRQAYA